LEAPVAALYIAFEGEGFEASVLEAVNAGGDTDTVACMVGAIVGARTGKKGIPEKFLKGLEGKQEIEKLADGLHSLNSDRKE
jgi:ADP-ribosylglycohydrolase